MPLIQDRITLSKGTFMNYVIGLLVVMAIIICLVSFPVPSLVGLALVAGWWAFVGKNRWH